MGLSQRRKGRAFEQAIAARFRQHWPDAVVRRASQAERADNPDVFIEGGPEVLSRLWLELTDARAPTPLAKLAQAETDIEQWLRRRPMALVNRMPVVVWHRLGERTSYVTTRLWVLDDLRDNTSTSMEVVTVDLVAFEGLLLSAAQERRAA